MKELFKPLPGWEVFIVSSHGRILRKGKPLKGQRWKHLPGAVKRKTNKKVYN